MMYLTPKFFIGLVVLLLVVSGGIAGFYLTIKSMDMDTPSSDTTSEYNASYAAVLNATTVGTSVFNLVGALLLIAALVVLIVMVMMLLKF